MKSAWWGIGGMGLGVGLMYWSDPRNGRWRRSHLQGKAVHAVHEAEGAVGVVARDMSHRTRGLLLESMRRVKPGKVEDAKLEERVRSALGRVCSHPGAIRVTARDGQIILEGVILADEHKRVLSQLRKVRGVKRLANRLEAHSEQGRHPDLQGGVPRPGVASAFRRRNWSPTARMFATLGALGLASWGLGRRGIMGTMAFIGGSVLCLRAITNLELRRLTGVGAQGRAIRLHKDITVNAPVEEVFSFWSAMHNFPRFMTHVDEVRIIADNRSRWRVKGPAGVHFEWEAHTVRSVPNKLLEWRSVANAMVKNAGVIHFEPTPNGGTRLDIRLTYNPPAGAIGHAFAKLLGADPKKQMDDDLLRFKSLLERGKATGRETVTREQLAPRRSPERTLQ